VPDALLDQFRQVFLFSAEAAGDERAPAPRASEIGFTSASMLPKAMLSIYMPRRLVGEVWPVVRP